MKNERLGWLFFGVSCMTIGILGNPRFNMVATPFGRFALVLLIFRVRWSWKESRWLCRVEVCLFFWDWGFLSWVETQSSPRSLFIRYVLPRMATFTFVVYGLTRECPEAQLRGNERTLTVAENPSFWLTVLMVSTLSSSLVASRWDAPDGAARSRMTCLGGRGAQATGELSIRDHQRFWAPARMIESFANFFVPCFPIPSICSMDWVMLSPMATHKCTEFIDPWWSCKSLLFSSSHCDRFCNQ